MTSTFYRLPLTKEVRRNALSNPSGRGPNTGYTVSGGALVQDPGNYTSVQTTTVGIVSGSLWIRIATLNIGTDLQPSTQYTVSAEITQFVTPGVSKQSGFFIGGSGVVGGGTTTFPAAGFTRRQTTFSTAASGDIQIYVVSGEPTVAGTNVVAFRDAQLERTATFDGAKPYFYGDTARVAFPVPRQYRWLGAKNASQSAAYDPDPAVDVVTPLLLLGPVSAKREGRSASYDFMNAIATVGTVGWGGPRTGEHSMIFATAAASRAALDWFSGYGSFLLVDDVNPWLNMAFIVDAQGATIEQTDAVVNGEFRTKLTVAYREIQS